MATDRPEAAQEKAISKTLEDGTPAHSFHTLVEDLFTHVRTIRNRSSDIHPQSVRPLLIRVHLGRPIISPFFRL